MNFIFLIYLHVTLTLIPKQKQTHTYINLYIYRERENVFITNNHAFNANNQLLLHIYLNEKKIHKLLVIIRSSLGKNAPF